MERLEVEFIPEQIEAFEAFRQAANLNSPDELSLANVVELLAVVAFHELSAAMIASTPEIQERLDEQIEKGELPGEGTELLTFDMLVKYFAGDGT